MKEHKDAMDHGKILRCSWAEAGPLDRDYHDHEWGRPLHDEKKLFELLILEGQQAGLSWSLILKRRAGLREAYDGFDPELLAAYDESKLAALLADDRVIRNRAKVRGAATNAKAYCRMRDRGETLDAFLWRYVDGKPIQNSFSSMPEVPAATPISEQMSKDMKRLGFTFVGPTILYAYMQSAGLVNDHLVNCHCYEEIRALGERK